MFGLFKKKDKLSTEYHEPQPLCPKGNIDEWNYKEFLRIRPLFEEACRNYEADPVVTFVRLYAPNPSDGEIPSCLRGIHLITASKKKWGSSTDGYEFVNLLKEVAKVPLHVSACIVERKGICVHRFSIVGTGMEKSPLYNGTYIHPKDGDYSAIDYYADKKFFPKEIFDEVELHPEQQPKEREDLYKFDNKQFQGKVKHGFAPCSDYRGRVNGELADFFITTDGVKGKHDENEMWYFLHKIGDGSQLYNSGRAHMRMSDDGESVVVDLSLDGRVIVDARDRVFRDGDSSYDEVQKTADADDAR